MQVIQGLVDLICIFAHILHGIKARSTVACLVFGEKGERGFDIKNITFFWIFSLFFGGVMVVIQKNNYRGDFQIAISPSHGILFPSNFFLFWGRILGSTHWCRWFEISIPKFFYNSQIPIFATSNA